ncbi:MAG: HD domain-containing protein [Methylococcales bacterium]|nr:HD domain-containing protein [Methylococcales bacterium]
MLPDQGQCSYPSYHVIAITEDVSPANVSHILKAGAETFLAKPFKLQDLLGILSHTTGVKQIQPNSTTNKSGSSARKSDGSDTLLISLARLAEVKNSYTGHHNAERLARIMDILGRSLGRLSPEELQALYNACALHDIGNVGIPDSILLKPGPLTEEEWTVMHSHTVIGVQLCII